MVWKLQENVLLAADIETLTSFIRTTSRFTQFTKVREFEDAFARWQGSPHCVLVNSGSSANLLLVHALKQKLGWKDSDEVIVPAVTWPTTITPIIQAGLKPVFSDVNLTDLSFDYERLKGLLTARTRAVFAVHLLGFPADIPRIQATLGGSVAILEDCCESQGAFCHGVRVGNMGIGSTFSFYWGHQMTTVEGGMLCTGDEELFKLLVLKRSHGLARELPVQYHDDLRRRHPGIDFNFLFLTDGFNVRNTEFNAVLGLSQLAKVAEYIAIRNRNYGRFVEMCRRFEDELIVVTPEGHSAFALPFIFRREGRLESFVRVLMDEGIECRPLVGGNLLRQPFLRGYADPAAFPNSEHLHTHACYVGNNQFVDETRLAVLDDLMKRFFSRK